MRRSWVDGVKHALCLQGKREGTLVVLGGPNGFSSKAGTARSCSVNWTDREDIIWNVQVLALCFPGWCRSNFIFGNASKKRAACYYAFSKVLGKRERERERERGGGGGEGEGERDTQYALWFCLAIWLQERLLSALTRLGKRNPNFGFRLTFSFFKTFDVQGEPTAKVTSETYAQTRPTRSLNWQAHASVHRAVVSSSTSQMHQPRQVVDVVTRNLFSSCCSTDVRKEILQTITKIAKITLHERLTGGWWCQSLTRSRRRNRRPQFSFFHKLQMMATQPSVSSFEHTLGWWTFFSQKKKCCQVGELLLHSSPVHHHTKTNVVPSTTGSTGTLANRAWAESCTVQVIFFFFFFFFFWGHCQSRHLHHQCIRSFEMHWVWRIPEAQDLKAFSS